MGNAPSKELEGEVRMVMIGKTGSGKSATGNSILQKEWFKSISSSTSITKHCRRGESIFETTKKKYNLVLVDTPGLYDTGMSNEDVSKEIVKCVGISAPGPHALLFIIPLSSRFTKEEAATALHFIELFGKKLLDFMIIVFTFGESLEKEETIQQRIKNAPEPLVDLIKNCGQRYVVFNNKSGPKEKKKQLKSLMDIVTEMIEVNGNTYYTNEMYQKAEEELKKRMEDLKKEKEKENQKIDEIDLRKTVRQETEQGEELMSKIGQGIVAVGKGVIETAVEATGISKLMNGLAKWVSKQQDVQN